MSVHTITSLQQSPASRTQSDRRSSRGISSGTAQQRGLLDVQGTDTGRACELTRRHAAIHSRRGTRNGTAARAQCSGMEIQQDGAENRSAPEAPVVRQSTQENVHAGARRFAPASGLVGSWLSMPTQPTAHIARTTRRLALPSHCLTPIRWIVASHPTLVTALEAQGSPALGPAARSSKS